jgi:hypothetical protein
MTARHWLIAGTVVDLLLFLPASYMAAGAVGIARANDSGIAAGIAGLFIALPIFSLACPMAAWRALGRGRTRHAAGLMLAPIVYAAFLVVVLVA